jgi:hypothetical protein
MRSSIAPVPYRSAEGQSLLDVINRAYKKPPIHIDLTLDDSEEELVENIPESVRYNARLLDQFLASDDEGQGAEVKVQRKFPLFSILIILRTLTARVMLSDYLKSE